MPRECILIIDDSARVAEFLTDVLAPLGYSLLTAVNGRDGLSKVSSGNPDLIMLDLNLPDRVIGAMEAINKVNEQAPGGNPFTDRDEELLSGAAAFVAMAVENARLHAAMRHTVAAKMVHDTVVALSQHVHNPLQALLEVVDRLKVDLKGTSAAVEPADEKAHDEIKGTVAQSMGVIESKLQEISVAVSVLQDISSPESTLYLGSIQPLDIEEEFRARLESVVGDPPLLVP